MIEVLYKIFYTVWVLVYIKDYKVYILKKNVCCRFSVKAKSNSNILNITAINNIDMKDITF